MAKSALIAVIKGNKYGDVYANQDLQVLISLLEKVDCYNDFVYINRTKYTKSLRKGRLFQ
jgi:hypothetical protein